MTDWQLRAATPEDLPAIWEVFYENEIRGDPDPPPIGAPFPEVVHTQASGEMVVADRGGHLLGFAGQITRGSVTFLTDLFVRPGQQSSSIGQALLERVFANAAAIRCTMSSSDPRAQALYIRQGLVPQWPHYYLRTRQAAELRVPEDGVAVVEADPDDPGLVRWDTTVAGRHRPQDHRHWVQNERGVPLWFRRGGTAIGYGYVRFGTGTHEPMPYAQVGPVGAHTPTDAAACVLAAVRWAQSRSGALRLTVPGLHPALRPLLEAGLQIGDTDTFLSDARVPFCDARCYVASGSGLF